MIVVVGLAFEARIAALSGLRVICRGDGQNFAPALQQIIDHDCRGLISFGVAGGLQGEMRPGMCVVGSAVVTEKAKLSTDGIWSGKLLQMIPGAVSGILAGADGPVATPAAKRALHLDSGAIAVDTESHVVAATAAAYGLPMAAIRVICDPVDRALPDVALQAVRNDGSVDVFTLLRSIAMRPNKIPDLLKIALDARAAHATLVACGRLLGSDLGFSGSGLPGNAGLAEMNPRLDSM
jgi:hopanoid-associated phosphorylase